MPYPWDQPSIVKKTWAAINSGSDLEGEAPGFCRIRKIFSKIRFRKIGWHHNLDALSNIFIYDFLLPNLNLLSLLFSKPFS
jgi:hypothetical protein